MHVTKPSGFRYKHVLVVSRQITEVFLGRGTRRSLLLLPLLLKHQNPAMWTEGIRRMNMDDLDTGKPGTEWNGTRSNLAIV